MLWNILVREKTREAGDDEEARKEGMGGERGASASFQAARKRGEGEPGYPMCGKGEQ